MTKGSNRASLVAVEVRLGALDPSKAEMCCKKYAFLFFPAFGGIFLISYENNCYPATTFKKIIDFNRESEIIQNISGSSLGSTLVALGSSWVAVGIGQNGTATKKYYFKSVSYVVGSRVAVVFIRPHKTSFLLFFCYFLTVKKPLVAVGFRFNIFSFQCVIGCVKFNCYHLFIAFGSSGSGLMFRLFSGVIGPVDYQKNRLLLVNNKAIDLRHRGFTVKGLWFLVLSLDCGYRGTWRIFSGKSEIIFTAHNYKKCGSQLLVSNKTNELQFVGLKKSVVGFGSGEVSVMVLPVRTHPPIKNSQSLTDLSHLLLAINCKVFLRVFLSLYIQFLRIPLVLRFRKVGGAGGVR